MAGLIRPPYNFECALPFALVESSAVSSPGSISLWLGLLKAGDSAAAQPLWQRYFAQLVRLARARLRGAPRRAADEEDVALSAFDSFCRAAEAHRFPELVDRDDLWQVLVVLTARKAHRLALHERRQKRGHGRVVSLEALAGSDGLRRIVGDEPTPDFAARVAEEFQRLLTLLGNEQLRHLAIARLEGYTVEELAARFECAPRTVERKLQRIRRLWCHEDGQPGATL
jgi:DNA-directed RNA polymerase specialized sigma24 family protein